MESQGGWSQWGAKDKEERKDRDEEKESRKSQDKEKWGRVGVGKADTPR